jgi:hypothetical protein
VPGAWNLKIPSAIPLGPWPASASAPILNTLDRVMNTLTSQRPAMPKPAPAKDKEQERLAVPDRLVLLLPPEDLELATDPRGYRVTLDALLSRLAQAGVSQIMLIAPFKFGCNEAHRKCLWHEVHAAAPLYAAKVLDPTDWMNESAWRADPDVPRVYAAAPNAAGRKMIEQALADLIR